MDDATRLKRLQKELSELKEKQSGSGVASEEYQRLEAERRELQQHLLSLKEQKDQQQVIHSQHSPWTHSTFSKRTYIFFFTIFSFRVLMSNFVFSQIQM